MSFFITTSALVIAVLIFLAWTVWKLKGKLAIAEFDLDKAQMEIQALEAEFVPIANVPAMFHGNVDTVRWNAVISNAVANNEQPARRIAWGKDFEEHLRRTKAREILEEPVAPLVGGYQPGPDAAPVTDDERDSIIERAMEGDA